MLVCPSEATSVARVPSMAAPQSPPTMETTANSVLSRLIEERSWTEVLSRLQTHPSEAAQVIHRSFGDVLPLHEACKLQPPANVVESLIVAFSEAVRTSGCQSSSLPVHLAMQTGSTEALAPLLRAYPAGARKKDDRGRLPIHLGCEWEAPPPAITALLTLYPESIYVRDANGKSPMDYAMKSRMGGDVGEIVAALKRGPAYCAVSKSACTRLKEEFDALTKKQAKAHEVQVAELKSKHSVEIKLHRQMEEGYRSGLKSMGEQSSKLRKESQNLKKEKASMQEQIKILQKSENLLQVNLEGCEKRLQETAAKLSEVSSIGKSRETQIQELEVRVDSTETSLSERSSQLENTKKELYEEREKVKGLTCTASSQAEKIEGLTDAVGQLEAELKESRNEAKEKGSSLQDATKCIGVLEADVANKEARISELSGNVADYEAQLKEKCAEIEAKDATIESTNEHVEVLSFNLDSVTKLSNDQVEQVLSLSSHVESLESQLEAKSTELKETSAALTESKERMEVLFRNLESILRLNGDQFERIERLNKAVISLSATLNAFIVPHDMVEKARAEQDNALDLILDSEDKSLLMVKVSQLKEKIMAENEAMEKTILSANPVEIEGVAWEHYVPQSSESMIGSVALRDFAPLEEKERYVAEMIVTGSKSMVAGVSVRGSKGESADLFQG